MVGGNRHEHVIAVRHQDLPPPPLSHGSIVVHPAYLKMGSAQDVNAQLTLPCRSDGELGMHQQAAQMRIADDLLLNAISAVLVEIGHFEAKRSRGDTVDFGAHMTALVVKERLAVGYQVLQITYLRRVDRGVI